MGLFDVLRSMFPKKPDPSRLKGQSVSHPVHSLAPGPAPPKPGEPAMITVYATGLDPASVTSAELQSYVRDPWQVENCLHFVKDRWWDEDRHYTKRPGLAEVFAALTNAALSVLRLIHEAGQPLRATAEAIQWCPLAALCRLGFIQQVKLL
jgi:hypothetical protein